MKIFERLKIVEVFCFVLFCVLGLPETHIDMLPYLVLKGLNEHVIVLLCSYMKCKETFV